MTRLLSVLALLGVAAGFFCLGWAFGLDVIPESARFGLRGLRRRRALEAGGFFASIEPFVRWATPFAAALPLGGMRPRVDRLLRLAGDWLGVSANEFVVVSLVGGVGGLLGGLVAVVAFDVAPVLLVVFVAGGALVPYLQVTGLAQARQKQVDRALPPAIDLAALCMGAGLDFTATLRQLVSKSGRDDDPLREELEVILSQLQFGVTRQRALTLFAERVPTDGVRTFVRAIVQSEEKGTPLADALKVQAVTLRTRRSVRGEEAAARAAVLMMVPLLLILCAILLVLMGPFVIRGAEGGF